MTWFLLLAVSWPCSKVKIFFLVSVYFFFSTNMMAETCMFLSSFSQFTRAATCKNKCCKFQLRFSSRSFSIVARFCPTYLTCRRHSTFHFGCWKAPYCDRRPKITAPVSATVSCCCFAYTRHPSPKPWKLFTFQLICNDRGRSTAHFDH